mmetsp:Transcript_10119/g.17814  ORF Transcript_10119/g.17814 Transcript_10119/m.17814 type:complete len:430 (+) Transcript_10119:504-1793(+)
MRKEPASETQEANGSGKQDERPSPGDGVVKLDPNPHPPPLVEEIELFKQSCCLRLSLFHEKSHRWWYGLPVFDTDVQPESNTFGTDCHMLIESQGFRPYMEDRYVAQTILDGKCGIYAVLDGHGIEGEGHVVSDFSCRHLGEIVEKHLRELNASNLVEEVLRQKLDLSMSELDARLRRLMPTLAENNGSTIVTALIEQEAITFANVGDSRGVLVNEDYTLSFVTLDHKPNVVAEERRVLEAGGFINDMRVNGDLAVSRTLGDTCYKPANAPRRCCPVSNEPDVTRIIREPNHRCVLLASDGLWDAMSSSEVVAVLKKHRVFEEGTVGKKTQEQRANDAFVAILRESTITKLSSDNITLLLVLLGKPQAQPEDAALKATNQASQSIGETSGTNAGNLQRQSSKDGSVDATSPIPSASEEDKNRTLELQIA